MLKIPTEPIGSIRRPKALLDGIKIFGNHDDPHLETLYEDAVRDTSVEFEAAGSLVITDGEQRKHQLLDLLRREPGENRSRRVSHSIHHGFCDVVSTTRETAFAKIRARVAGT